LTAKLNCACEHMQVVFKVLTVQWACRTAGQQVAKVGHPWAFEWHCELLPPPYWYTTAPVACRSEQVQVYTSPHWWILPFLPTQAGQVVTGPTGLIQVTVSKTSDLIGKSIKEIGFRGRFGAAVLAGGSLGESTGGPFCGACLCPLVIDCLANCFPAT
jgi:hypothetical protein